MSPEEIRKCYEEALRLFKASSLSEAIQKLESLIQTDATFEDAYEALAICYSRAQQLDRAIEVSQQWIRLNPRSKMAHANLSRFYAAQGMIAEAEHEQAEARRLGWAEELKDKKLQRPKVDPAEKIERFKKVIALDPADVLGYYSLGDTYSENGRYGEAVEVFTKALEVDRDHTSSYLGLGQAFEALGEREQAAIAYRKGIEVAQKKGDVMPQRKMENRLRQISSEIS